MCEKKSCGLKDHYSAMDQESLCLEALSMQEKIGRMQEKIDTLKAERDSLRQTISDTLRTIGSLRTSRAARLTKMMQIFSNPGKFNEKNIFSAMWKKFIKKEPLAANYDIFCEVTNALMKQNCYGSSELFSLPYSRSADFAGDVFIFASVPFDDIGGGQRSAQFTRCMLQRMFKVTYIYKYPKVENGMEIANEYLSDQFSHIFLKNTDPETIFRYASGKAQVIFEFPHPDFLPYLEAAKSMGLHTIYELIDPWDTSLGSAWYTKETEQIFIDDCSTVTATAKVLRDHIKSCGRDDVRYVPNAADTRYFGVYAKHNRPADYPSVYNKNIIYFGSMYGEWFDWGALKTAAMRNPDTGFVMIGEPPADRTNMPANILFLGMRQNFELAAYLAASDAAIIPFRPGKLVDAVSPIKVFEYLFSGKPVITLRMPEVDGYPGVYQADNEEHFAELCSLRQIRAPFPAEKELFVSANTWNHRLDKILNYPSLRHTYSIIILIHNNGAIIERILDTLLFHTAGMPVEVIVVDNASKDNGPEIVEARYAGKVKLIRNPENGCASGRNLGASHAANEQLIFFDSDQWFSAAAWLYDYDLLCDLHPEVGAFAWNAGWFADVTLHGPIVDYHPARETDSPEYLAKGFRTDMHYLATSGFFISRELFQKIGGLDTFYDPTIFEDTDLSMRVLNAGYQIAYRDFAGIMHQPHQTTKASDGSNTYQRLFERNSEYFRKRWLKNLQEMHVPGFEVSETPAAEEGENK